MSILITKIINCPFCRARVNIYAKQCPTCASDLSLLSDLNLLPYALYNQGVDRFREDDMWGALLKLSAAVELRKDFEEARVLLAEIAKSLGFHERANSQNDLLNIKPSDFKKPLG